MIMDLRRIFLRPLNSEDLSMHIADLKQYYTPVDLCLKNRRMKKKAVSKMITILNRTQRETLQTGDIQELLHSSLTTVYYFGMQMRLFTRKSKSHKKDFNIALMVFQKLMDKLFPEMNEITVRSILSFISVIELWSFANFVSQMLEPVLKTPAERQLLDCLLEEIRERLIDIEPARHRIRVFYDLLQFTDKHKLPALVTRLKDMYCCTFSLVAYNDAVINLRNGIEACFRRIFERVENDCRLPAIVDILNWCSTATMTEDEFLKLSRLLVFAAKSYEVGSYESSLSNELFTQLLEKIIASRNKVSSLFGSRILMCFLDRQRNSMNITIPRIFYDFSQNYLRVVQYNRSDKKFLEHYRERIHASILSAVRLHFEKIPNIMALFILLCCMILEVPCGFTAAAVACMVMAIQEFALSMKTISTPSKCRLHVIVGSVLSLICWVHKGEVLYRYVSGVVTMRHAEAPQLNPPLLEDYGTTRESIWSKPTLFFDHWELRYGIWCHFRDLEIKENAELERRLQ